MIAVAHGSSVSSGDGSHGHCGSTTEILRIFKPRDRPRMTSNSKKCTYCGRRGHTIDERKLLYVRSI